MAKVYDEDDDDRKKAQNAKDKRAAAKAKAKAKAAARKAAGKGADKGADKGSDKDYPNARDLTKNTLDKKACFKLQTGNCKNKSCNWAHICAICGKEGCAAFKHKQ